MQVVTASTAERPCYVCAAGSMMDEQSMEELRMSLSRRHLPRARPTISPEGGQA